MVKSLLFDTLKRYVESLGGRAFKPVAITAGEFGMVEIDIFRFSLIKTILGAVNIRENHLEMCGLTWYSTRIHRVYAASVRCIEIIIHFDLDARYWIALRVGDFTLNVEIGGRTAVFINTHLFARQVDS